MKHKTNILMSVGIIMLTLVLTATAVSAADPTILSISPDSKSVGDQNFTITVTGANYGNGAQVYFAGIKLNRLSKSSTQLTATVPSDLMTAGLFDITVKDGSKISNAMTFTVNKVSQTITFGALAGKTFGDAPFDVSATATSGLPVSFGIVSGPSTISGSTVTITGAGTVTVRASQVGNASYNAAQDVSQSFTISKEIPTITWSNPIDITYGTALSVIQLNAESSTPGSFVYNPLAGVVLNVGTNQNLHVDFIPTDAVNFSNAYKDIKIDVVQTPPAPTPELNTSVLMTTGLAGLLGIVRLSRRK